MSSPPAFAAISPSATESPFPTTPGNGSPTSVVNPGVEGNYSSYAQVYNGKTTLGGGTMKAVFVHNDGTALIIDSANEINFVDVTGTATDSGVAGRATTLPITDYAISGASSYHVIEAQGSNIFYVFKGATLIATITPTQATAAFYAMSGSGQYIIFGSTDVFELWKGS